MILLPRPSRKGQQKNEANKLYKFPPTAISAGRSTAGHATAATITQTLSGTRPRADPKTGAMFGAETDPPKDVPPLLGDTV